MTNPRGPQRGATSHCSARGLAVAWLSDSFRCRPIGSICSAWLLAASQAAAAASREQRLANRVLTNVSLCVWSVMCVWEPQPEGRH